VGAFICGGSTKARVMLSLEQPRPTDARSRDSVERHLSATLPLLNFNLTCNFCPSIAYSKLADNIDDTTTLACRSLMGLHCRKLALDDNMFSFWKSNTRAAERTTSDLVLFLLGTLAYQSGLTVCFLLPCDTWPLPRNCTFSLTQQWHPASSVLRQATRKAVKFLKYRG
jgi:hypothetical protein